MGKVQKMFADERLLQGAPLLPTELVEEKSGAGSASADAEATVAPDKPQALAMETGGSTRAKEALKELLASGWAQEALDSVANITGRAQAAIKIADRVLALTRARLEPNSSRAESASGKLEPAQLWELAEEPEFQHLLALLLAKGLQ